MFTHYRDVENTTKTKRINGNGEKQKGNKKQEALD